MKVKQIISEMPAMNRSDIGFGMTQYLNDRYALVGGYRSGSSDAGETRLKYDIYSVELVEKFGPEKGKIGFVEFRVSDEDGEILGLINIELSPKFRKGGHGAKIIQDIKDTTRAGGFDVHDIQKKAKKFWNKVGIKYTNNQSTQGRIGETLDEEQVNEAGGQIITYLNDKGKKVTGSVVKRSTNSPKGYFLDTGEFVSQQQVIAKESLDEVSQELLGRASDVASEKWHTAMNKGIDAQKRRDVKGMDKALGQAKKRSAQADKFKQAELNKRFSEATPDEEEAFHQELDNLVHRTFGNSEVERQNEDKDPCWKGYKQIGMKKKGGKEVPNCVPVNENEITVEDADEIYGTFDNSLLEAEYQGRKVELNKPIRSSGGPKKFHVFVKNDKGNVVKVNFGDPNMSIKKSNPERRKSFRARHNCDQKKDKTTAGYWSCRAW